MLQLLRRAFHSAVLNFKRNGLLTVSSVGIMVLTLGVILGVLFVRFAGQHTIRFLEEKINFSLFFKQEIPEEEIKTIQKDLGALPQVRNVEFVSAEEALAEFQKRHAEDRTLSEALQEVGQNPLVSSLVVQANVPRDYDVIYAYVENAAFRNSIEKITYYENQDIIRRVNLLVSSLERAGIVLGIILIILSALVTHNTIRLAIYSQRDEIAVMRLVGASNWFIRAPFIITGVLYGVIAAVITALIVAPVIYWSSPYIQAFVGSFNLWGYFSSNFLLFSVFLVVAGALIGGASTVVALNKYLNV